ncbi:STAS domain-containing protein [Plantactinospora soyae]|uniref:Anti-sigma factor antagonist n=1 Tax=Plantactinospora soyae TaxID=1544732 RepID=A0A927M921_9ACTN|nr:STAS domain-containing protein [Plantactinospora soyae]MBE1490194.1 anti-anti-sigma factor [Plantactinospora soyae]
MAFSVSCTQHADFVRLHLNGELDIVTVPDLHAALDRLLEDGQRRLLVDLTELTFCDSSGLAAFVRGDDEAGSRGGWLRLTGATGRVDRVLRISGLAELFRYDQEHDRHDPAPLSDR